MLMRACDVHACVHVRMGMGGFVRVFLMARVSPLNIGAYINTNRSTDPTKPYQLYYQRLQHFHC